MRLVLDTNEYIGALGIIKNPSAEILLIKLIESTSKHSLFIPRTIIDEVRRNLSPAIFAQFIRIIRAIATIDENFLVPFEIGAKYVTMGLKPADAFIAAYTEWAGADLFISENRHFLYNQPHIPFKVVNAAKALKILQAA